MRAILQRVKEASVTVDGEVTGAIDQGLLIFLGCGEGDGPQELAKMVEKVIHLRIFADDEGRMNHSLIQEGLSALVVSQFTLYADTSRGRRPSFGNAMGAAEAEALYEDFVAALKQEGLHVETGVFGAMMDVALINDGPVTITLDSDDW